MYQIGDYIVYKRDVCKVKEIKKNYINDMDYYILIPKLDNTLKIEIPVTSKSLRNLISKEELEKIIDDIQNIDLINADEKNMEQEYRRLLNSGSQRDLIRIIKTAYMRNQARLENKKKIGDKDNHYFEEAEKNLYNEFGTVLGLSLQETKDYVINKVENMNSI